jgi:putative FmdB family regulatory protein
MPIYDYKCVKCEHEFEYFHQSSSDDTPECPECKTKTKEHEKQIPKQTSFILKGGGWAKDRYGR